MIRITLSFLSGFLISAVFSWALFWAIQPAEAALSILSGNQGGTGFGTSTVSASDIGKCLSMSNSNPLTYTFGACAGGGGGGGSQTLLDWNASTNIISTDGASTTATTSLTSSFFTAASTTGSSTLPRIASTILGATTAYITNLFIGVDTLAEYIADTAGAMFSGNTETDITVTYDDADNTVDFTVDTLPNLTGTLDVDSGGTGATSFTAGGLVTGNGANPLFTTATGTLTENITGLEFDVTRSLVGGAAVLNLTSGYAMPLSTQFTEWSNKISSTSLSWTDSSRIDGTYTSATGVFTADLVANSVDSTYLADDITISEATSTVLSSTLVQATTSSSTNIFGGSLRTCDATTGKLTWSNGAFGCGTDFNTGGGGSFPFSSDTNYGQTVYSTSTPTLWFKSGLFASSTSYFVNASATASFTAKELNGVKYANAFDGTDIGAKINAAYAALGTDGGTIYVSPGSYTFSTPIDFGTDLKRALLKCGPGTTFNYSGSATSTFLNYGYSSLRFGQGIDGCNYNSNNGTTSDHVAIQVGGTNGAQGSVIQNLKINNFNKGIAGSANSWGVTYDHVLTQDTPYAYVQEAYNNSGEAINFINTFFADGNFKREVEKCVWLHTSGAASFHFVGGALDNCGMTIEDGSYQVSFSGTHFENPFPSYYGSYRWIVNKGNAALTLTAPSFVQQATAAGDVPNSYVANAGRLVVSGGSFAQDAAGGAPAALINNYGSGKAELYGVKQFGTAATVATSGISFLVDTANTTMHFNGTASSTISTSTQLFANQGTTTHWTIGSSINLFGGGSKTTANALCIQLTGSSDLCDGSDASGGGGGVSDWVKETNFGALALTPTTTIPVWLKSAIYASSTLFVDGNVSIGTSTTNHKMSIFSAASTRAGLMVTGGIGSAATPNANSGQILLGSGAAASQGSLAYDWALGDLFIDNTWNDNQGDILFRTKTLGGTTTALAILGSGNVGVSTSSPFSTLSVHKLAGTSDTSVFALASSTASATTTLFLVNNIGSTTIASLNKANCDVKADTSGGIYCGTDTGGSGSPAGSDGNVQYNDGGAFGGMVNTTWDDLRGQLGFGTTSPSGIVSIASSTFNFLPKLFTVGTSSDQAGEIFTIAATSSPVWNVGQTFGNLFRKGYQVVVGTFKNTFYNFYVNGSFSSSWRNQVCHGFPAALFTAIADDRSAPGCEWIFWDEVSAGTINVITTTVDQFPMNGARGALSSAATADASRFYWDVFPGNQLGTTTPTMEITMGVNTVFSSTTDQFVGFWNSNVSSASVPTRGCGIAATTTPNWQAYCHDGSTFSGLTNTNIATSSTYAQFKMVFGPSRFMVFGRSTFNANYTLIANITTGIPSTDTGTYTMQATLFRRTGGTAIAPTHTLMNLKYNRFDQNERLD